MTDSSSGIPKWASEDLETILDQTIDQSADYGFDGENEFVYTFTDKWDLQNQVLSWAENLLVPYRTILAELEKLHFRLERPAIASCACGDIICPTLQALERIR